MLRGESDTLSYLHLLPCPALTRFTECTTDQWWGASACKDMQCSSSAHYCTSTTGGASAWWTFGRSTRRPQCRPATRRSWCHQEVLSSATPVQEVSLAQGRLAASWPTEELADTLRSYCLVYQNRGRPKTEKVKTSRVLNFD